jgi:hypothetical protein
MLMPITEDAVEVIESLMSSFCGNCGGGGTIWSVLRRVNVRADAVTTHVPAAAPERSTDTSHASSCI